MSDDGISWLQNALWPAEKGKKGDEVVIVTGCSSGIGERIMIELAHQGYTVFATTRTGEVPTIPGVYGFKLDVSEDASIRDFVRNVTDKLETFKKPLRALINNAGVAVVRPAELISRDVLLNSLNVNFVGPAELSRLLLPLLKASKGRIINISSMAAWMHPPWYGSYCAAKAAISAWSDCLRREIQASGVKVSVIEPGKPSG